MDARSFYLLIALWHFLKFRAVLFLLFYSFLFNDFQISHVFSDFYHFGLQIFGMTWNEKEGPWNLSFAVVLYSGESEINVYFSPFIGKFSIFKKITKFNGWQSILRHLQHRTLRRTLYNHGMNSERNLIPISTLDILFMYTTMSLTVQIYRRLNKPIFRQCHSANVINHIW